METKEEEKPEAGPEAPTPPRAPTSRMKVLAVVIAIIVLAAIGGVLLLSGPAQTPPRHEYVLVADSNWFELPADQVANVTGSISDLGDPVFGVTVTIAINRTDIGELLDPETATTNNAGVATFRYHAFSRLENATVSFTLTAQTPGGERTEVTEVKVLHIGAEPTMGQVKGLVTGLVSGSPTPLANATVQVTNLATDESFLNATGDDGRYVVREVTPGTVSVTATRGGFKTAGVDVLVEAGKNAHADLELQPLAAGTLVVWHTYEGKEKDEFEKIIDRYRLLSGATIEVEAQPFGGAIDKYITAALAGNAPDVMRFQNDRLGEVAQIGLLEPLGPYMTPAELNEFTALSRQAMSYRGELVALPATADLLAIVYNKGIFTAAGEPFPTESWTTDDLFRIARNLTDEANGRWGFVQPATDPFWWFPWQKGYGGHIFDPPEADPVTDTVLGFDLQPSALSLQWMQSLDKDPAMRTMPARPGSESMMTYFFQGQAAMIAIGAWRVPDIQSAEIDFGIVPYPVVASTGERAAPTLGVKGFGVYKFSTQKPAAVNLVKYITSVDEQITFSLATNDLPTVIDAFADPGIQANPIIIDYQRQAQYAQPMPTRPEMGAVWNPITAAMEVVYNRANPSVAQIQQDMAAAEQQILERISG